MDIKIAGMSGKNDVTQIQTSGTKFLRPATYCTRKDRVSNHKCTTRITDDRKGVAVHADVERNSSRNAHAKDLIIGSDLPFQV